MRYSDLRTLLRADLGENVFFIPDENLRSRNLL